MNEKSAGSFGPLTFFILSGGDGNEPDRRNDEKQHEVTLTKGVLRERPHIRRELARGSKTATF